MSAAKECLENEKVKKYLLVKIGTMIKKEIKTLSSFDSILKSQSLDHLMNFKWELIINELQQKAPIFLSFLKVATKTHTKRANKDAVICMCVSILLKYSFKELNLVQKLISLILYWGHASKRLVTLGQNNNFIICNNTGVF